MRSFRGWFLVAVCVFAAGLVPTDLQAWDASDLLFYHSFDAGAAADFARGGAAPVNQARPSFADGVAGRGLSVGQKPEHTLTFPCAGNLDAREGTLAFWILPVGWDPNGIMKVSPTYLNFGGKGVGVLVYTWGVDNDTKFLMQHPGGAHVASLIYSGGWTPGWNHVACTWRRGEMVTYHNGVRLVTKSAGAFLLPEEFLGNFNVGGHLGDQNQTASTVLDDLYLFRRALVADEVRLLYEKGQRTRQPGKTVLQAGRMTPKIDGALAPGERDRAGVITALVDRFTGRPGEEGATTWIAHDDRALYLAVHEPVPEPVRKQPVFYPTGAFKDDARRRDGPVRDDDSYVFTVRGGDGALYEFAVNAAGALRDSRNGDISYNAAVQHSGHADTAAWTFELAVPWKDLGYANPPRQLSFNERRVWKRLQPGLGELAPGAEDRAFATLNLVDGSAATIAISPRLASGKLTVTATAPSGQLELKAGAWSKREKVTGKAAIEHPIDPPASGTAEVVLADQAGAVLCRREVPFARLAGSESRLIYYPGAGVLRVGVDAIGSKARDLSARVTLVDSAGREVASATASFEGPRGETTLDVSKLAPGKYTVRSTLSGEGRVIDRQERPFQREPLPAWYRSKAGIVDYVPPPWTDMTLRRDGQQTTIGCWGREFRFGKTLLPTQIVSRGAELLAAPIRLRAKIDGREVLFTEGEFQVTGQTVRRESFAGKAAATGGVTIGTNGWIEFDGLMWFDLSLEASRGPAKIEHLVLELPLRPAHARLVYSGSYGGQGTGILGPQPRELGNGCWIGDGDRGIQWLFPSQRGWAFEGTAGKIEVVPGEKETVVRFRLIDKPVTLGGPRRITLGLHPTPVKPMPKDYPLWRFAREADKPNPRPYRFFDLGAWGWAYPNYPVPKEVASGKLKTAEERKKLAEGSRHWQKEVVNGTTCYYMFGPWAWIGSPEYAQWRHEWAHDGPGTEPDPRSEAWGPACHGSSFNDLVAHLMQETAAWFPIRGLYFDCTGAPECSNPYHGCGYVDESGVRRPEWQILATRRYYERLYTILKAADPESHVAVHMSGQPHLAIYAFADSLVEGEQFATGLRGRKGTKPEQVDYFDYVTLPLFRAEFAGHNFGLPVAFLPEFCPASGDSPESRRWWYGTGRPVIYVGSAPAGHEAELYEANRAVEHLVGLSLVHDARLWATYAVMASQYAVWRVQEEFGWGPQIEFLPYWNNASCLTVEGGVPEKVVASLYRRKGRVLIVPFNDTDQPVKVQLRLNLAALGLSATNGTVKDLYRWQQFEGKTDGGKFIFRGTRDTFEIRDGVVPVVIPPRSFRMLAVGDGGP